ncbi:hypothetical protein DV738_g3316, partial [Chaetothyriales sp. CBS 135597]
MSTADEGHGTDLNRPPSSTPPLPRPPEPENDRAIVPPIKSPVPEEDTFDADNLDIFTLKPLAALKLLCRSVDSLIDGVPFLKAPIGSPEAQAQDYAAREDIGARAQPAHIQHGLIARKFWSKRPPPISLEDYLLRMHKFCPMSAAVYLATNHYIRRLAVHDRLIPVTPRNVHRLVLAGLRVAMKALEDLSWPHSRFSKVGGVSEGELSRLEITFCFLMDFSLKVDPVVLQQEAQMLAKRLSGSDPVVLDPSPISTAPDGDTRPKSRSGGEKRKANIFV